MQCPRCRAELPEVAHFCHHCGQDVRTPDLARRKSFAVKPDEPVASFSLVSTIMPRGATQRPQTYRLALVIALTLALVTAIFGALPLAVLVAAFAIPIVYIVYLYDVNLWEDEPLPVTGLAFGLTAVLGLIFTLIWQGLRGNHFRVGDIAGAAPSAAPAVGDFLLVALLVPIIGEAIRQIGPLILASRPEFDDLMDGLTFGIISGVAYASVDTIVKHWDLLTGGWAGLDAPGMWASLIFLEGFVKPLIMGTATGIACAEFSGLGAGYDGFTGRWVRGVGEAILANIAYQAGTYLFSFLPNATLGVMLSIAWGLLILGVLVLRVRNVLHHGLMEAALESEARDNGVGPDGDLQFCPQCEMPLLLNAGFCNACGAAVRTRVKPHHARPKAEQRKEPAMAAAATSESAATSETTATSESGVSASGAGEDAAAPSAVAGSGAGATSAGSARPNDRDEFYDDEESR